MTEREKTKTHEEYIKDAQRLIDALSPLLDPEETKRTNQPIVAIEQLDRVKAILSGVDYSVFGVSVGFWGFDASGNQLNILFKDREPLKLDNGEGNDNLELIMRDVK